MNNQNNNQNKKKYYKTWWFWLAVLLAIIVIGSVGYNVFMGGTEGIEQHQLKKQYTDKIKDADNKTKDDNNIDLPSLETVNQDLRDHFDTSDLSDVDYSKIDKYLNSKYDKKQTKLIESGYLVSANMTPSEQNSMEVEINNNINDKSIVGGVNNKNVKSDILTGKYTSNQQYFSPVSMSNKYLTFQIDNKDKWDKFSGHEISAPILTNMPSNFVQTENKNGDSNNNTFTAIVFIKPNDGDTMKDIDDIAQDITLKYSNGDGRGVLIGKNGTDVEQQKELKEFSYLNTIQPLSKNYMNAKTIEGSRIPIVFELPESDINSKDDSFTLNMNNKIYKLTPTTNNKNQIVQGVQVP